MGRAIIESKSIRECIVCHQITLMHYKDRCRACGGYFSKYKRDRTPAILQAAEKRARRARWCKICGYPENHCQERCAACYRYWMRSKFKHDRPRYIWDKEAGCKNCERPLSASKGSKGYCVACYNFSKKGKVRPRELWGIGVMGWCECGRGATMVKERIPLCEECAKDW